MTSPEQNAEQIAANTRAIADLNQAVNFLVSEFIRPNTQQHIQSLERLERIEVIIEAVGQQQQANAQQIASNAEAITQYDARLEQYDARLEDTRALLEDTRSIVAENGSQVAQLKVAQQQVTSQQDRNAQALAELIEENRAFRESQQSQLAAIIGNGRRIDRLEQQAS